jgi:hypothetical protein
MPRRSFVPLVVLAALLVATPVGAITYGQADGNKHPNVGALIGYFAPADVSFVLCSGTLVAADLYLTAAHCVVGLPDEIEVIGVSFAAEPIDDDGAVVDMIPVDADDIHPDPGFPGPSSDPRDLAIVELDPAPVGLTPAQVPTLNQIGAMAKKNGLRGQQFTAVGYGAEERTHVPGSGQPQFGDGGTRMNAVSTFNAINSAWLRLSQNPATGNGGTCYGDSGGPNFLGAGTTKTNLVAAVTVTGDSVCRATNVVYRLDSASAQAFLDDFGLGGAPAAKAAKVGKASADRAGKRAGHGGKHHRGNRRGHR